MSLGFKSWLFYSVNLGKRIPSKESWEILKYGNLDIALKIPSATFGGLMPAESTFLNSAAAFLKCRNAFEIGTCSGVTAYNLACNMPGKVFTLDLPAETSSTRLKTDISEQSYMNYAKKLFWEGKEHAERIVVLKGDSAVFDFAPYFKKMDLVFVDASHSYEYVKNDSKIALKLLAPGGMIVWHDYMPAWKGVVHALNELSSEIPLVHLKGTSMVVHLSPELEKEMAAR